MIRISLSLLYLDIFLGIQLQEGSPTLTKQSERVKIISLAEVLQNAVVFTYFYPFYSREDKEDREGIPHTHPIP